MPIRMDFGKKRKEKKENGQEQIQTKGIHFKFFFILYCFLSTKAFGFNKYLPITIHNATRNRRKWQEKGMLAGARDASVSQAPGVFLYIFLGLY